MAENKPGVYLKPLVRNEMDGYVDGYGNKREWRKYNKTLNVSKLQVQPNPFQESITFRAMIVSEEPRDPNNSTGAVKNHIKKTGAVKKIRKKPAPKKFIKYLVTIRFHGLEFKDVESKQFNQKWEVAGRTMYSRTPSIRSNRAMIKCQCRDFMFTWEKPLADDGGLWPNNRWTKYTRLTPVTVTPPRNPNEKMGYCKHIATFLQYLNDSGMLSN